MTAPERQAARSDLELEVEAALAWHDEDPRATIATLLLDCKYLREQLALARIAMSIGFARGWAPCPERRDEVPK
ncbi:hypothetical protein [Sinorhizobium saheli]|uniref:Uncharacterized protein n=1 Tax=Sinorhizobium saheli TaxID=36856 RepID=A0A178XP81_SINSA|nr:hypothetical protein [Sinorhizobium saheli]MQW90352.1 hypothetical protein [Sinorhizobium saheli]OAP37004.1 hypothetical protein ATB98_21810 [Sinorhizobium saheli]